jgi:hypothetical protein
LTEPPGDLVGLLRTEELVDPARSAAPTWWVQSLPGTPGLCPDDRSHHYN